MTHTFCRLSLLLLLLLCVGSRAAADVADPPVATTDESNPTYYLIQNWKTREYYLDDGSSNAIWSYKDVSTVTTGSSKHNVDHYLFYFVKEGSDGYKIGCKTAGLGKYLDKTDLYKNCLRGSAVHTRETGFTATGTVWYIAKCQYNNIGVEIRDDADNYWRSDNPSLETYNAIKLHEAADQDEQVWVLWSLDDLIEEAKVHGVTGIDYEGLDPQQGSSFKTLVDAISAKQKDIYLNTYKNSFKDGEYLLRSRQYGTYLNTDGTAMAPTVLPTQYSVWTITRASQQLTITGHGGKTISVTNDGKKDVAWNIATDETDDSKFWHPDFQLSSDKNNRYVSFTQNGTTANKRWFGMGKTAAETKEEQKPSTDWELIPVENYTYTLNGTTYRIETSIESEDELLADDISQSLIVRVRNVTRSVEAAGRDVFNGGGYLEDVDHTHFTHRKDEDPETKEKNDDPDKAYRWDATEAELMYSARTAEFYAAKPNDSHASALWQLQCVSRASTSNEAATGHILPQHNIYILRNLNTGKYIRTDKETTYPDTTGSYNKATRFLLERLTDGQYGLYVYDGTSDKGVDALTGGIVSIAGEDDGYVGGLCYMKDTKSQLNSNGGWVIARAPTLDLQLLITGVAEENGRSYHTLDWTTLYYPFDVVPVADAASGQQVRIYQGCWAGQYEYDSGRKGGSIQMTAMADVPAGNAVFVTSSKPTTDSSFDKIVFNVYPAGSGKTTATPEDFATNVWRGIVESDGKPEYYWGTGSGWRDVWVLSTNTAGCLRLLHPSGDYLLPNRAYIDTETVALNTGGKVTAFDLLEDDHTTGIETVDVLPGRRADDSVWYTLDGRRLTMRPTQKGIYIYKGKKTIVK